MREKNLADLMNRAPVNRRSAYAKAKSAFANLNVSNYVSRANQFNDKQFFTVLPSVNQPSTRTLRGAYIQPQVLL